MSWKEKKGRGRVDEFVFTRWRFEGLHSFFLFVEEAGPRKNGREINSVWKLKEKERTDYKTQKNRRTNNDLKSMNLSYAQQAMD